jgi:hypothetical protein
MFFENSRRYSRLNVYHRCYTGVNNTGDKFIDGVVDTGDKTVLTIPACLDLKMKNKQKFNLKVYRVLK